MLIAEYLFTFTFSPVFPTNIAHEQPVTAISSRFIDKGLQRLGEPTVLMQIHSVGTLRFYVELQNKRGKRHEIYIPQIVHETIIGRRGSLSSPWVNPQRTPYK